MEYVINNASIYILIKLIEELKLGLGCRSRKRTGFVRYRTVKFFGVIVLCWF